MIASPRLATVVLLLLVSCLPACDDDESPPVDATPVLAASPTNRDVPYMGGTTTFSVANPGGGQLSWVAAETCSWVDLGLASGTNEGPIIANYDANPHEQSRVCEITVSGADAADSPRTLTITQDGSLTGHSVLAVWPTSILTFNNAGTQEIHVANTGRGLMIWKAETDCDFFALSDTLGVNDDTITVSWNVAFGSIFDCHVTITAVGAENSPQAAHIVLVFPGP